MLKLKHQNNSINQQEIFLNLMENVCFDLINLLPLN